ncbi:MAG: alpha-2-macroglobulin family protein [Janthinobacterium lividum]
MNYFCSFLFLLSLLFNASYSSSVDPSFQLNIQQEDIAKSCLDEILEEEQAFTSEQEKLKTQVEAVQAWNQKDYYYVNQKFKKIVCNNPRDFVAWIYLSKAYADKYFSYDKKAIKKSFGYALNAYKIALDVDEKCIALQQLTKLNTDFKVIYEKALGTLDPKTISQNFDLKTNRYPNVFDIYEQNIPETSDIGTVCLSWTKPLLSQRKYSFENFVSIAPVVKDLAIIARQNQLCFKGLEFGANYQLTLKKDLPGEQGYKLTSDKHINLFLPHRKPGLAFRERGYILPAHSPQIIPLNVLNINKVDLQIIRLPLNGFSHQIFNQGEFLQHISPWKIDNITNYQGEKIASGSLDITSDIDQRTTAGLKLEQLIEKKLEPGIYILQANPHLKIYDSPTTQWLIISDIGLSTYKGPDGLHVFARSLETAKMLSGIEITLIARNGRELSRGQTNDQGYVKFEDAIVRGENSDTLMLITAQNKEKDFTFLRAETQVFDFVDRGVKGRQVHNNLDVFVFTERGIYRPGETVSLTALIRDQNHKAIQNIPLTFKLKRPDGVEVASKVVQEQNAGSYTLEFPTQNSNTSGNWKIEAYIDPKGSSVSQTEFYLADFVPPRINFTLDFSDKIIQPLQDFDVQVAAHYYYGPVASDLKVETIVELIEATQPFEAYTKYYFGLEENPWNPYRLPALHEKTDAQGKTNLKARFSDTPNTTKILEAQTTTTVFEANGRGRTLKANTLFWHQPYVIGIEPLFQDKIISADSVASFNVITLNEKGERQAIKKLTYNVYQENQHFTYFQSGNTWNYNAASDDRIIASGVLETQTQGPTSLKLPVKSGRLRIEIMNEDTGVATSFRFNAGWDGQNGLPERPDLIEITLDKASYKIGDKVYLNIVSPYEGELFIAALNNTYQPLYHGQTSAKSNRVEISLDTLAAKQGGLYLMATVFKPGDSKQQKMLNRAMGLIWINIEDAKNKIDLTFHTSEITPPNQDFVIKACVPQPLKDLYLRMSVVDEGILNLSNFEVPNPFDYFFGQTHLQYQIRDSYGFLINPYGTRPVDFNVGGGSGSQNFDIKALSARVYKTLSLVSPILKDFVPEKEGYCTSATFKLPEFAGNVRISAVAWTSDALGHQTQQVIVRDPLEIYLALPQFLAPQDLIQANIEMQNLMGKDESIRLNIKTEGAVSLKSSYDANVTLKNKEQKNISFNLLASDIGLGKITLETFKDKQLLSQKSWEIAIRSSLVRFHQYFWGKIESGQDIKLTQDIFKEYVPGTALLTLNIGTLPTFGADSLAQQLKKYPYTCLEQLSSRLAAYFKSSDSDADALEIANNLDQIYRLQRFDGSFALWNTENYNNDIPWLSVYAIDLLYEANHKKWNINKVILQRTTQWMQNYINNQQSTESLSVKSYIHYILAREGLLPLGTLKYFADNNYNTFTKREDILFMACAFAHLKDVSSAQIWLKRALDFKAILSETDLTLKNLFFESDISKQALMIKIIAESFEDVAILQDMAMVLADKLKNPDLLSTFEKGWLVRAALTLSDLQKPLNLTEQNTNNITNTKVWQRQLSYEDLKSSYALTNKDASPVIYSYTLEGDLKDAKSIPNLGFDLTRQFYNVDGQILSLDKIKSGDCVIVVFDGLLKEADTHEVLLLDLLPAGFEIDGLKIDTFSPDSSLTWLTDLTDLSRVEKREDRFVAAFRLSDTKKFKVAYMARAVTPGQYTYPAASVESMYRPQFSARTDVEKLVIIP